MLFLYIAGILGLASIEGYPLVTEHKWKELAVYSLILAAGLGILIIDTISLHPARVADVVSYIFRPYWAMVEDFLLQY